MLNIVLLLVMLSIGMGVVMCLDFRWLRSSAQMIVDGLRIGEIRGSPSRKSTSDGSGRIPSTSLIASRTSCVNRTVGVRRVGSAPDRPWCRYGLTRRRRGR